MKKVQKVELMAKLNKQDAKVNRYRPLYEAIRPKTVVVHGVVQANPKRKKEKLTEMMYRQYIEYVTSYVDLEGDISCEISDDTRLTKGVFMYRRDLINGITLRADDLCLRENILSVWSSEYSEVSKSQLLRAICTEFGAIHAEFVEDLKSSEIIEICGTTILIDIRNTEALSRINAASKRVDEVFKEFGLIPMFIPGKEALQDLTG